MICVFSMMTCRMRSTFEKNPENLASGAAWSIDDPMEGPSERIVLVRSAFVYLVDTSGPRNGAWFPNMF